MLPKPIEVPGEKIYELITAADGLGFGVALVELTESRPHKHEYTAETYKLLDGAVELSTDSRSLQIVAPRTCVHIPPGTRHWAKAINGKPAHVLVISTPAWTEADHHLAP
ncbi:cupin domain-containing protein [Candidatus Uhrbacteria bacterium]|nr:cupin domain-containing protein [Candidatus Uhrbacteria bacterium]